MAAPRPVIILAGAPRLAVDALRYLTVRTSGATAAALAEGLRAAHIPCQVMAGMDACPHLAEVQRFVDREQLEGLLQAALRQWPDAVVVSSAAINDYAVHGVSSRRGDQETVHGVGGKIASGADEICIRLRPAPKLIDQLADWGHRGPLVAFKYEDAQTVLASAQALRQRCGAVLVVANSLCGMLQAMVTAEGVSTYPDRPALLAALGDRLLALAQK